MKQERPCAYLIIVMLSMSTRGTKAADWDKDTWAALEDLARNHPDAGIHFQGKWERIRLRLSINNDEECEIHSRSKDVGTTTAKWFGELLSPSPWFKDVVPNVSNTFTYGLEAVYLTIK